MLPDERERARQDRVLRSPVEPRPERGLAAQEGGGRQAPAPRGLSRHGEGRRRGSEGGRGDPGLHDKAGSEIEVLDPLGLVHVVRGHEVARCVLPADEDVAVVPRRRERVVGAFGQMHEIVLEEVDPRREPPGPKGPRPDREPPAREDLLVPPRVLRFDDSGAVDPLLRPVLVPERFGRQTIERRDERPGDAHRAAASVRVVGVQESPGPVGPEQGGVAELDQPVGALDILVVEEAELLAEAEEVRLGDAGRPARLPPAASKVQLELRRPGVLGRDLDVHDTVVRLTGGHPGGLQERQRAEVPLGLRQALRVVRVPFAEQQESPDHGGLRFDVEGVREPIDPSPALLLGREDVQALDPNLSDAQRLLRSRRRRGQPQNEEEAPRQVPSSQELMYRSCSGVGRSIAVPIDSSFRRAISRSIASGTA